jgi:hypothetical protein
MKFVSAPDPGNYYLYSKDFLDPHSVIKRGKVSWALEKPVENLVRFFLPMAHVLGFCLTENQLVIILKFHPENIIRKLPRQVKHMDYQLKETDLEAYLQGKMPPICKEKEADCSTGEIHYHLTKKISNFLHSFTIKYNSQTNRSGCLFSRKTTLMQLETKEEIQNAIAQTQNIPVIQENKIHPESYKNNSTKNWGPWHKDAICWTKLIEIFSDCTGGFIGLVRRVYEKIIAEFPNTSALQSRIPGCFFINPPPPCSGK